MNKKISIFIALTIIIVFTILLIGSILAYQYWRSPKKILETEEAKTEILDNEKNRLDNKEDRIDKINTKMIVASYMSSLRVSAELFHDKEDSYVGFDCDNSEINLICDEIKKRTGSKPTIISNKNNYCIYVKLYADENSNNKYGCVDDNLRREETDIFPGSKGYCDGKTFNCPYFKSGSIKEELKEISMLAIIHYDRNNNSYSTLHNNPELINFKNDIDKQGGNFKIFNSKDSFCAYAKLNEGGFWCTDSIGYMGAPADETSCQSLSRCK